MPNHVSFRYFVSVLLPTVADFTGLALCPGLGLCLCRKRSAFALTLRYIRFEVKF